MYVRCSSHSFRRVSIVASDAGLNTHTSKMHCSDADACYDGEKELLGQMSLYLGHQDASNETDNPADQPGQDDERQFKSEVSLWNTQCRNANVVHACDGQAP